MLVLWSLSHTRGYSTGLWATYSQWQQLGAQVRKGEKAAFIVFWKVSQPEKQEQDSEHEEQASSRNLIARDYAVFNAAQVEGYTQPEIPVLSESERLEQAEGFIQNLCADICHGDFPAGYVPLLDRILMPWFARFREPLAYYAVLAHELVHWSGAPQRLHRELSTRFESQAYTAEELVAELGSAFLCADLGLALEPQPDHAAYIASWLSLLASDKRAIFTAASRAQQAVDWMHAQQPTATTISGEAALAANHVNE